jgi:negative regulator of flagellin synthesis FlgM
MLEKELVMISGVGSPNPTGIGQVKDSIKVEGAAAPAAAPSVKAEDTMPMTLVAALAELGPPVDTDKIQAIRTAIAQGRYPLDAKAIADKMISLDLPRVRGE